MRAPRPSSQATLFPLPPRQVEVAPIQAEHARLAALLPDRIRLGAMTWSYKGWVGLVYGQGVTERQLAAHGLTAYAKHPLFRIAELDRTYYEPLGAATYREYAQQVPNDFRFFVKAHEDCTVRRYPLHARYGAKAGQDNPLFLDAAYARRMVAEPLIDGLGERLGALLFQFPPQDVREPGLFVDKLHAFLRRLPRGVTYAVELRNRELLTRDYGAALADCGAVHCHNAWTDMPGVISQARAIPPSARRPLIIRWLLRPNERFEDARVRYTPFDKLVAEDLATREAIATLVAKAHAHGVPSFVLVDNKAEGCAPVSIARLAQAIADKLAPAC